MLFLLDTNVLVELRRKNPIVIGAFKIHSPSELCCSVLSVGEIFKGLAQFPPEAAAQKWQDWKQLLQPFTMVDFTLDAAMLWGRLLHETRRQPIGPRDLLLAATALAAGMTMVTHNVREFRRIPGLLLEDWQAA
jgi:tRNA(fMet)-specific endonuclease VapC